MASIRKRSGKWQVRINRDDITVTKTFFNKKDGEAWARRDRSLTSSVLGPVDLPLSKSQTDFPFEAGRPH